MFQVTAEIDNNVRIGRLVQVDDNTDFEVGGVFSSDGGASGVVMRVIGTTLLVLEITTGVVAVADELDNVSPFVASKATVAGVTSFHVIYDVKNPQENTYTFYFQWSRDTATEIECTPRFVDIDSDRLYGRHVKNLLTNTLVEDMFVIDFETKSSVTDVVMRNEKTIEMMIEPDVLDGNDELFVMIKSNNLHGNNNRG